MDGNSVHKTAEITPKTKKKAPDFLSRGLPWRA